MRRVNGPFLAALVVAGTALTLAFSEASRLRSGHVDGVTIAIAVATLLVASLSGGWLVRAVVTTDRITQSPKRASGSRSRRKARS